MWPEEDSNQSNSRAVGMRELAMIMSFDTSDIVLGAAGVGDDSAPNLPQQDRADVLARRPFTFWGHGSFTKVDNSRNQTGDDARYNGDVWGYNVGGDYQFNPQFYAGASLGYSKTNLTTTFNTGTYDEGSWSVTPYAVYNVTDQIKVSALAGYAISNVDQTRTSSSVRSSTDSKMAYAALNGSYKVQPNPDLPLDVTAQVNLLAANKKVDAYSESDGTAVAAATSNTRQVKPGVEAAYSFEQDGTVIQPFVKGAMVYDFKDPTNNDAGAYDVGGGVRLGNGGTGLSGLIEGQTQLGRDDYSEYTFSAMVAYSFGLDDNGGTSLGLITPYVKSDFTEGAQVYATGVGYNDASGWMSLNLDVTQTLPTDAMAESATDAMARANLKF